MKLNSETNTPEMSDRIQFAAAVRFGGDRSSFATAFDHGQWWVTDLCTGSQYSVVDAEADTDALERELGITDGFLLELVTEGELS